MNWELRLRIRDPHHHLLHFGLSNASLVELLSVFEESFGHSIGEQSSDGDSPAHAQHHVEVESELTDAHTLASSLEKVGSPQTSKEDIKGELGNGASSGVLLAASEEEGVGISLDQITLLEGILGVESVSPEHRHLFIFIDKFKQARGIRAD